MLTFCLRANSHINLSISSCSRGGERKKDDDKGVWGLCIFSIRNDEAVTCVLWHLKNMCIHLSWKIRILYGVHIS